MKKLTDICDIQYGYAFDSKYFTEDPAYPPLVRIRDVKRGYSETYYSGDYPQEYVLKSGDLLIGMDGEFNIARWKSDGALLNQRVCKLIVKKGTNEEYLRFAMSKALKKIEQKTAFVTVKHLSAKELNKLQLYVPDLSEQNKVAEILSRLEVIIDVRRKEVEKLDELIKARFIEMFGTFDLSKQDDSWRFLSDIATIYTGTTPSTADSDNWDGDILWITPAEIKDDSFFICDTERKITEKGMKSKSLTIMPANTVLLSTRAPIGKVAIAGTEMCCNQGFKNFCCKPEILNPIYLYTILRNNNEFLNSLGTGTTFKEISKSNAGNIKVPLAKIKLQNEFADFVKQVDKSKYDAM